MLVGGSAGKTILPPWAGEALLPQQLVPENNFGWRVKSRSTFRGLIAFPHCISCCLAFSRFWPAPLQSLRTPLETLQKGGTGCSVFSISPLEGVLLLFLGYGEECSLPADFLAASGTHDWPKLRQMQLKLVSRDICPSSPFPCILFPTPQEWVLLPWN